jgi:hypothetical protein
VDDAGISFGVAMVDISNDSDDESTDFSVYLCCLRFLYMDKLKDDLKRE